MALKYINKTQCVRMSAVANIFREKAILIEVQHPFVVNLRYAYQDEENMFMVIDLMLGGDLRYQLDKNQSLTEETVKFIISECACAVAYLHSHEIVHRDLKPENILLDEFGHAHLTDFNIAVHFLEGKPLTSRSGTHSYMGKCLFLI
jgi:serine/threonine kinase 32